MRSRKSVRNSAIPSAICTHHGRVRILQAVPTFFHASQEQDIVDGHTTLNNPLDAIAFISIAFQVDSQYLSGLCWENSH